VLGRGGSVPFLRIDRMRAMTASSNVSPSFLPWLASAILNVQIFTLFPVNPETSGS
jgi:hypothetical protein